jgi:hypothetical protein
LSDAALNAAVRLLGHERGHALLGCDWGTLVAAPDDREVCVRQARQIVALYNGDDRTDVRVCLVHRDRLLAETTPRSEPGMVPDAG